MAEYLPLEPEAPILELKPKRIATRNETLEARFERIGESIAQVRRARRISQAVLAKAAETSVITLIDIEKGRADTHIGTYLRIADLLGIRLNV